MIKWYGPKYTTHKCTGHTGGVHVRQADYIHVSVLALILQFYQKLPVEETGQYNVQLLLFHTPASDLHLS